MCVCVCACMHVFVCVRVCVLYKQFELVDLSGHPARVGEDTRIGCIGKCLLQLPHQTRGQGSPGIED